jgi:hypothetical protein
MENINSSNIKLLICFYKLNEVDKNTIIDYYKPISGYLYCLFNPMYKYYGANVKKCGNTIDLYKRKGHYSTPYIEESEFLLVSEQFIDKTVAEMMLFYYLNSYRIKNNREFFDCDIDIIKKSFEKVKLFFENNNTIEKLFDFLLTNYSIFYKDYHYINKNILFSNIDKDNIFNSKDINESDNLNEIDDKYSIIKYNFKCFWNLDKYDKNTFYLYFGNEIKLIRLFYIYNIKKYDNNDTNIEKKTIVIKNIINTLGFNLNNLKIKIMRDEYYLNVKKLLSDDNYFKKDYKNIRIMFGKEKHNLTENLKNHQLSKLLNGFLNEFGFNLINKKTCTSFNNEKKYSTCFKLEIDNKFIKYLN